jgi:hypothetical protein
MQENLGWEYHLTGAASTAGSTLPVVAQPLLCSDSVKDF